MAIPSKIRYWCIRGSLVLVLAVALLHSLQLLTSSIDFQKANALLESIHQNQSRDYEELLNQIDRLEVETFPAGGFSGFHAHALSLIFSRNADDSLVSEEEVKSGYLKALESNPYDGFLWAKLAYHRSRLNGVDSEMLHALDSAVKYARNDYNTFKVLLGIAIRDWPRFDCSHKQQMLDVVNDSSKIDDRLLSRWNGEHGHMNITQYVASLTEFYNFDPSWAANQVRICKRIQGAVGE